MLNIINGIFDLTMTYADRKILFCVLIKLNLLTKMLKMINEIKKNEVEEKELNGGPIISAIRRIVILIARVFTVTTPSNCRNNLMLPNRNERTSETSRDS